MYRPGANGPARAATPTASTEDRSTGTAERALSPGELAPEELSPEELGPEEKVNLGDDEATAQVQKVLDRLDTELVGLTAVKRRIREIAALLTVDRARGSGCRPASLRCT